LAQNLARLVIKRGYKPFVVIRHENEASKSLYNKLGFHKEFEMARIVFTPQSNVDEALDNNNQAAEDEETATSAAAATENTNGNHVNGCNGVNNKHSDAT